MKELQVIDSSQHYAIKNEYLLHMQDFYSISLDDLDTFEDLVAKRKTNG